MNNDLKYEQSGQLYEVESNHLLIEECPNLYIIPMMHNVDVHNTQNVPLVIINISTDSVYLLKGEIMDFMQNQSLDISEIITETSTEPSPIIWRIMNTEGLKEQRELPQVIAQIPPPPMDVPMPIRKALLVDRENKTVNYLLCREYELNKTSWSKLQKKYNISRNKIYAALKGKGRPRGSQYQQKRKQMVKPETTASTSHSKTVND